MDGQTTKTDKSGGVATYVKGEEHINQPVGTEGSDGCVSEWSRSSVQR